MGEAGGDGWVVEAVCPARAGLAEANSIAVKQYSSHAVSSEQYLHFVKDEYLCFAEDE